jgi:23S rRNA (guanosine2251-2'-O)-methyltransferase
MRNRENSERPRRGDLTVPSTGGRPEKLTGIHAVREALAAGRPMQSILIGSGRHGGRLDEIVRLAREHNVPVRFEDRMQLDRAAGSREHQGVVALLAAGTAITLHDLLSHKNPSGQPGLLVLLDGVEDPQNLGAVIRTALAAGASGVILPERRTAGLTEATARASAGAVAHLPIARVTNLVRSMEELKSAGYWLVGLDERAERHHSDVDMAGPVGIVLGGEGKGLHQLVRERCDFLVAIPTSGPVRSLNVSVAAGIALFEVVRQRAAKMKSAATSRAKHRDKRDWINRGGRGN